MITVVKAATYRYLSHKPFPVLKQQIQEGSFLDASLSACNGKLP